MRPVVAILVGHYLPGHKAGGPIRSVANLVAALGEEFDFRVLTADRDLGDAEPYPGLHAEAWNLVGLASVRYIPPERLAAGVARALRDCEPDLVYSQSYFSPATSLLPRLRARARRNGPPFLVAPRGEFSPGALAQKAPKKRAFLALASMLRLDANVRWHSTSPGETEDIRRTIGPRAEIFEAPPLPSLGPDAPIPREKSPGELHAVFVSRVSPKKNLEGAIRALAGVPGARLTVYGPKEDSAYWERCVALARELRLPLTDGGTLAREETAAGFGSGHVFLFPTLGENYGHAIMESLQAGTPVIVSDRTPWRDLRALGVGWDLPLGDEAGYRDALIEIAGMDEDAFRALSFRAWRHARDRSEDPTTLQANRALLEWAIDKS